MGSDRATVLKLAAKELRATFKPLTLLANAATNTTQKASLRTQEAVPVRVEKAAVSSQLDPRQSMAEQASAFFAREAVDLAVQLNGVRVMLELAEQDIADKCRTLATPDAPALASSMGLGDEAAQIRICRSWSYASSSGALMYVFDKRLADKGDPDAASRLPLHMLLGNDKGLQEIRP